MLSYRFTCYNFESIRNLLHLYGVFIIIIITIIIIIIIIIITYYDWEVADLIKKADIVRLDGVNHIIPSYCHLQVSCRSLVDRCDSLGSCKPHTHIAQLAILLFYIF